MFNVATPQVSGGYMRDEIKQYREVGRIKFVTIDTATDKRNCQYKRSDLPIGWVLLEYQQIKRENPNGFEQKKLAILAEGRNVKEDFLNLLSTWNKQKGEYFYGPA